MRVELIASDRQSEMLAVTLTNRYRCNNYITTMHSRVCIEGQTRTDNLMIPDHEFYQLKYFYIFSLKELLEKGSPVASHRGSQFSSFLHIIFSAQKNPFVFGDRVFAYWNVLHSL